MKGIPPSDLKGVVTWLPSKLATLHLTEFQTSFLQQAQCSNKPQATDRVPRQMSHLTPRNFPQRVPFPTETLISKHHARIKEDPKEPTKSVRRKGG